MDTLIQDLKHALKMFRESPGFTATAVAALTLGIGVNTAIFSVVNAVLLKPVPFPEPDRLVYVLNSQNGEPGGGATSPAKLMHYRAQTEVLEDVTAVRVIPLNYTGGDIPEQITAGNVSAPYFRLFRAPFAAGRGFRLACPEHCKRSCASRRTCPSRTCGSCATSSRSRPRVNASACC